MRHRLLLALALAAAFLAPDGPPVALAAVAAPPTAPTVVAAVDSLPLPAGEIRGLAWLDGATLAVLSARPAPRGEASGAKLRLVVQDRTGAEQARADLTGKLACGLAFDGRSLWSAGEARAGGALLHRIDPGTLKIEESFPIPGHRPSGVAWDGEGLWLCDRDGGLLSRFDPATGEIVRSGRAPAFSPAGLAWDGAGLLVADVGTGRLYRVRPGRAGWTALPAEIFALRGRQVALTARGGALWLAPAGGDQAYLVMLP